MKEWTTEQLAEREKRLTVLLMTVRNNPPNYTVALDNAKWIIDLAECMGWEIIIEEPADD